MSLRVATGLVFRFLHGNFLEFNRLLAADARTGFEGYDVAGGAEVANSKQVAVVNRVEPVDFERPIRLRDTLQTDFAAVQALVLHRVE